jgi:hypothetical protein
MQQDLNIVLSEFLKNKSNNDLKDQDIDSEGLIKWFVSCYDSLPKYEFDIWRTITGFETWHEPQRIYDFIIKSIQTKNKEYFYALNEIKKLKNRFENINI